MKSVTRGNAGQDASLPDSGAMPVMAGDDAFGDGGSSRPGGQDPGRVPLRELMDDRLLDALLERSRDQAGGLRLTGEGSMLGELAAIRVPRAVTAGADSRDIAAAGHWRYQVAQWLAARLQTTVIDLPGAHMGYLGQPEHFAKALRPILDRHT